MSDDVSIPPRATRVLWRHDAGRPVLAVHYSPQLDALWPRWRDRIDRVKVGPWTEPAVLERYQGRIILHGIAEGFVLSSRTQPGPDFWSDLRQRIAATGTPWLSDHIAYAFGRVTLTFQNRVTTVEGVDPLEPEEAIALIIRTIDAIEGATNLPFLGENLDYVDVPAYQFITEPSFISEVLRLSGCDLLLDTAHARIAADWLGMPIEAYLEALPLERTREIHYNGPTLVDGHLWDAHALATDEDERILGYVLDRCRPEAVTLEYRGDDLEHEVERLHDLLSSRDD